MIMFSKSDILSKIKLYIIGMNLIDEFIDKIISNDDVPGSTVAGFDRLLAFP